MKISFRDKILALKEFLKNVFEKYPLTMIIVFAYTIFGAIIVDTDWIDEDWVENIIIFGIFWGFGTFFCENIVDRGKVKKVVLYGITGIVSFLFTRYIVNSDGSFDIVAKLSICYITTISAISLFMIIKKSDTDIPEYLLKVAINFVKINFVYGVLSLGILIIYEIFNFLILDSKGGFIDNIEILVFGFYYLPKMIYALTDLKEDVHGFFKGLVKYVLISLVSIAFIIIYIYIIKILILRDMPKNQIFRILSALFIVGAPIWTCMQYFKDDSFSYKISLKLPLAFIPFIFLQIYTIGIRISKNGLTPLRYACIALVLFEIIYILFYIIRKEKLHWLIIGFDLIIIVSILIPGVNMFDLSNISQANILKTLKTKSELSDEEKDKIYGAYKYLQQSDGGKKYIDDILSDGEKDEIKTYISYNSKYSSNNYEYFNFDNKNRIMVKGYTTLIDVNYSYYGREYGIDDAFKSVKLKNNSEIIVEVDLTELFNQFLDEYNKKGEDSALEFFENKNEFIIDNNSKVVIDTFSLKYDTFNDEIGSFSIRGYYLEK